MAYIPVEDTVLVETFMRLQGEQVENTLYFLNAGGWNTTSMLALAALIETWWTDEISTEVSNELTLVAIKVTDLTTQFSPSVTLPITPPVAGADMVDPLPNNGAAVIKFTTEARGRSFRGRNYLPGIPDQYVDGNTLDSGLVTNITAGYTALEDVESAASCVHVVVSRFSLGAPRLLGVTTEVSAYSVDPTIRTQRRRLPR